MNFLVIALFLAIFYAEYLVTRFEVLPAYVKLLPELLSAIALLLVLSRVVAGKGFTLDGRYALFFVLFLFTLTFGFVVQDVPSGAIVAGIRDHLKFVPFFLLACVYSFNSRQLKAQFAVLLLVLFSQVPLVVYQRFVEFGDSLHTGDPVRGTASTSSALSILMMTATAAIVSLYLRRKLRLPTMLAATALLFLPTTLNETKATLVMLPIVLLLPAFLMPERRQAMRRLVPVLAFGCVAVLAYVASYNYFVQYRQYGYTIESFIDERAYEQYLYTGEARQGEKSIGRLDSIRIAADHLSADPFALSFGLGAGNVAPSNLPGFDGRYASYYDRYGVPLTQISNFLWQIGIVGLATYLLLYSLVFRDARALSGDQGAFGVLGQTWATVIVIMTFSLLYKSIFSMNEIGYLFWFYSGFVASKAYAQRKSLRRTAVAGRGQAQAAPGRNGALPSWGRSSPQAH